MLTPPQPEGPAGASDADTCAPLTLRWFLGGSRSGEGSTTPAAPPPCLE